MADEIVEVVVEIPKGSRNKYEYDHEHEVFRLDRRLFSASSYPGDYGFIPETLGEDGDPLDALVLVEEPTFPGCRLRARPVGVFLMEDEEGPDAKILCVLEDDPLWEQMKQLKDIPPALLAEVEHFFDVYKMLEPHKKATTIGYEGKDTAFREISEARKRAKTS